MCKGLATLPAACLKGAKDIKHKISFLLQKPEVHSADQKQVKEKSGAVSAKRVPDVTEVEKWKQSFCNVMSSDAGRSVFSEFLKSEFSEENLDFWMSCEDYKRAAPPTLSSRAKQIYQQYVKADAPKEVNLDAETREETRLNVENPSPLCFDKAQKMIFTLMEKDSYRRFLKSKLLQDLCVKEANGGQETEEQKKKSCECVASHKVLASGA